MNDLSTSFFVPRKGIFSKSCKVSLENSAFRPALLHVIKMSYIGYEYSDVRHHCTAKIFQLEAYLHFSYYYFRTYHCIIEKLDFNW